MLQSVTCYQSFNCKWELALRVWSPATISPRLHTSGVVVHTWSPSTCGRSRSSKSSLLHSKFRVSLSYLRLLSQKNKHKNKTTKLAPARLSQLKGCVVVKRFVVRGYTRKGKRWGLQWPITPLLYLQDHLQGPDIRIWLNRWQEVYTAWSGSSPAHSLSSRPAGGLMLSCWSVSCWHPHSGFPPNNWFWCSPVLVGWLLPSFGWEGLYCPLGINSSGIQCAWREKGKAHPWLISVLSTKVKTACRMGAEMPGLHSAQRLDVLLPCGPKRRVRQ